MFFKKKCKKIEKATNPHAVAPLVPMVIHVDMCCYSRVIFDRKATLGYVLFSSASITFNTFKIWLSFLCGVCIPVHRISFAGAVG